MAIISLIMVYISHKQVQGPKLLAALLVERIGNIKCSVALLKTTTTKLEK